MDWGKYIAKETFNLTASTLMYPLHFANLDCTVVKSSEYGGGVPPIILVHGYLHNHSAWVYLRNKLKGVAPIYTINLNGKFSSIQKYADQLSQKVQNIVSNTNSRKVTLIGHSMGGVVASFYCEFMNGDQFVDKCVTIGSPLAGTKVADKMGIGDCAKSMQFDSDFCQALCHSIHENNSQTEYHHIYSAHDQVVLPQKSARIKCDHTYTYKLLYRGHLSLLYSKEVFQIIQNILSEEI